MKETESSRAEIQRKLTRMVRFIELEGDEKTQEILDRTEEEFHIEKGNLIQEARIKINQEYDKQLVLLKNQSQVALGIIKAKFHEQTLQSKRKTVSEIYEQVHIRIKSDLSCVNRRWTVLQLLIMEGLFRLLEKRVTIQCREADAPIISKHLTDLEAKYELHTKTKINLTIDSNFLAHDILPGIVLTTNDKKVKINNTLENRIEQVIEFITPVLSTVFYGTKKFRTNTQTK